MTKVQFDLLDQGYVELKLAEIQKMLWEAVNYAQGFPMIQKECEDSIYELQMQKEALPDTEAEVDKEIKRQQYNLDKNKRKLEQQLEFIEYFQNRIKQIKGIIKAGKDFTV